MPSQEIEKPPLHEGEQLGSELNNNHQTISKWKDLMSPDTLELIISYLEAKYRMVMELVCLDLRIACLSVERREFFTIFDELNDETLVCKALNEQPVSDEEIENFERRIPGFKIDFYTRELLSRTNGRMDWHDSLFHPVNMIAPIQEWTKDFGYLYYKDKSSILQLLQLPDFNFAHDCLVCIGSASQKLCWGTSDELEYNPFHARTRKLYADKNFNLYDLEYKGCEDFTFKKLGNLKKWFKSFLPQHKLNVKIVPKREPIRFATDEKRNDPEFVKKYLKTNGSQLKYVSKELRNNKELIMVAVSNYLDAIQFASDEIKDDEMFMKDILQMHPLTIRYCSGRVKESKVTEEVLKSYPFVMEEVPSFSIEEFIPRSVINDKGYALSMIEKTYTTFYSLSDEMKNDRDICLRSVRNGLSISKISPIHADDKEIALIAVTRSPYEYMSLSEGLRKDRDVALITLKQPPYNIGISVPYEIRDDKGLILEVANRNNTSTLMTIITDRLKTDKEVILKFLSYQAGVYHSLDLKLKEDVEILSAHLLTKITHGEVSHSRILDNYPDQVLYTFCNDYSKAVLLFRAIPSSLGLINRNLRSNKKFIMEILDHYRQIFRDIDLSAIGPSLLRDEEVLMKIANKGLGEELLKVVPHNFSDKMVQHLVMTNPITIKHLQQTPDLVKLALGNCKNCHVQVISLIKEEFLTVDLVKYALENNFSSWSDIPSRFQTRENILKLLEIYPKLFCSLLFTLRKDAEYLKLGIREPTNFKAIPTYFHTSELIVEALQHNNPKDIEKHIYPHIPAEFYANEEIYKLLKENIPSFK